MKSNKVQKDKTKARHLLAQDTGQMKKNILDKSSVTLTERKVNGSEILLGQRDCADIWLEASDGQ